MDGSFDKDAKILVFWNREKRKFELEAKAVLAVSNLDCEALKALEIIQSGISQFEKFTIFAIPRGFLTDFGSIPRPFKPFFNPIGKEVPAYLLHDYLCFLSNKGIIKRAVADKVFFCALKDLKVSFYRRLMLYFGVRCISLYRHFIPFQRKD